MDDTVDELLPVVAHAENSGDTAVSPKGAIGKYQIMPATARGLGVDPNTLTDPQVNEGAARSLLGELNTRYKGDRDAILAAYNAGPKAADAFLAAGRDASVLPRETRNYLTRANSFVNEPGLPQVYQQSADARAAGYSWGDIDSHLQASRSAARNAGYSDAEIDEYLGIRPSAPPTPLGTKVPPPVTDAPELPQEIRSFAEKYLTPSQEQEGYQAPPIKTAGDFWRSLGWDTVDVGKILGRQVVNGVAAIMEGLDGRPRTKEDMVRLGVEAQGALAFFAGGPKFSGGAKAPEAIGMDALRDRVPPLRDVLDAAKSVNPEGDITPAAQAIGQHYVETGEKPVDAAARAQSDPALMDKLGGIRAIGGGLPTVDTEPPPSLFGSLVAEEAGTFTPHGPAGTPTYPREAPDLPVTPETIATKNPGLASAVVDDLKRIFSPASRGPDAEIAANILREGQASVALKFQRAADNLRAYGRSVAELSSEQRLDFNTAIETGDTGAFKGTPLGDLSAELRKQLDDRWKMMDERGEAPNYIQNYLPHIYQDPDKVANLFAKRPMEGSKFFTKERTFATLREAMESGFQPVTLNPIELSLTALHQMDRYIAAHDMLGEMKDNGLVMDEADFPNGPPPSAIAIDTRIARMGNRRMFAPEEVGTLINRAFSPGLSGRPVYDVLRSAGNMMNSAQLGLSGFHAGFVTADAFTSGIAKGVKQISRFSPTEMAEGIKSLAEAPAKPFINYAMGRKIINQLLGHGDYGPEVETLADALIAGGGRVNLEKQYMSSAYGSFWQSFRGSIQRLQGEETGRATFTQDLQEMLAEAKTRSNSITAAKVKVAAQLIPRIMDTTMAPLMEHYVPTMKVGVFADLMRDELRLNPEMDRATLRATAGRVWDSVDNRLGQLVYDNLFWDKTMRDVGHLGIRSLGWNLGSIRELGGGAIDLTQGRKMTAGEFHQITDRASYAIAVPIATALMGATYAFLKGTWNSDFGIKDYLFPPTGGKDNQGGDERANMPGYMKDVYDWLHSPLQTAQNKIHPMWPFIYQMMTNRQWNGAAITDPRSSIGENVKDYLDFIFHQFQPIAFKNSSGEGSAITTPENFLGIKPAPYAIREPEREAKFNEKDTKQAVKKKNRMDAQQ